MGDDAPVLVGVDGSDSGLQAVSAAVREARLRGTGLNVVHAFIWPLFGVPLGPAAVGPPDGGLRSQADEIVGKAVRHARELAPDLDVDGEVVTGHALPVMAEASERASLAVIGSRGLGAFTGLLLGSTAVHLAAHGSCPVLVVRGRPDTEGPVVLGVDGSPAGTAAVGFAFAEASKRGTHVVAVHAAGAPPPPTQEPAPPRTDESGTLTEAMAQSRREYPDVQVKHRDTPDDPREALIAASKEAGLVVVGARGRGGFAGLLLGSVSQALLHHAHCPVAVVRGDGKDGGKEAGNS
jgi:nucleotide-binding universal stress UspA family protein